MSSVLDIFISRISSIAEHLRERAVEHKFLREVLRHETPRIVRMATEFCTAIDVSIEEEPNPKRVSCNIRDSLKNGHQKAWNEKPQHGYLLRKQQSQTDYDKVTSNAWLDDRFMTSHVEGYICAMQEQEIRTRLLIKQRENPESSPKCRYCKVIDESIFHILNSCSFLSASLYLPVRHNEVAKVVFYGLLNKFESTEVRRTPEAITRTANAEVWWDRKIGVQPPIESNRPDIVVWNLQNRKCLIIDICIPMDVNVAREEKVKTDKYILLASRLQRLYPDFSYQVVPIVVGSTGYISKKLPTYLEQCGFDKEKATSLIPVLQRKALRGSMKIVKTALKLKRT